jgi:hypothetical protein
MITKLTHNNHCVSIPNNEHVKEIRKTIVNDSIKKNKLGPSTVAYTYNSSYSGRRQIRRIMVDHDLLSAPDKNVRPSLINN